MDGSIAPQSSASMSAMMSMSCAVQWQDVVIVEESAVEMQDLVRAEISARVHGAE